MGLILACGASDRRAPDPTTLEIAKPAGNSGDVYHYHCATHGATGGVGMSGTITVEQVVSE